MKQQIEHLASNGLTALEIARTEGISLATVYRYLDLKKDTPPPRHHDNRYRNHLARAAWRLVVEEGIPKTKAATHVLETEEPYIISRASASKRPVTPPRLVKWMKPEPDGTDAITPKSKKLPR